MKRLLFTLIYINFLIPSTLFSQNFFKDNDPRILDINRTHGLNSLSVSAITQDRNDIIWLGTQDGLHRFNGTDMEVFSNDPFDPTTIPNNLIQTMFYDKDEHKIYIGTYNGISIFDIENETFTNIMNLSNKVVIAINKDNTGNIWVGTLDGLNIISKDLKDIKKLSTLHKTIRTIYLDSRNRMWVGSYGGVEIFNTTTLISEPINANLPSNLVMNITEYDEGSVLIGMWNGGAVKYSLTQGITQEYTFDNNNIYSIEKTLDGSLWFGSWGGGIGIITPDGEVKKINDKLSNSVIYCLFEDNNGLLWVGTNGGGGHIISPRKLDYQYITSIGSNPNKLPKGTISKIYRDKDDDLWISVDGKGLFLYDDESTDVTLYSTPSLSIKSIINDSDGNLLIGTDEGLAYLDKVNNSYTMWEEVHPNLPLTHNIIIQIYFTSDNKMWVSTYGEGINIIDLKNNSISYLKHDPEIEDSLNGNTVYGIIERSNGEIWVATNNGLGRYNPNNRTFKRYIKEENNLTTISGNNIRVLYEDSQQNLWIGSQSSGLNRFIEDSETFANYTTRDGLSNNNILSILEGRNHEIWVATRAGISMINTKKNYIKSLYEDDGLHSIFFNTGHYKDRNGDLLFGNSYGIIKITNFKQYSNNNPPGIIIKNVSINNSDRNLLSSELHILKNSENNISFEYIGIDYESTNKITYKYKLEGLDEKWINANNKEHVSYTLLPSGDYEFKVKAINSDGVESLEPETVKFQIESIWYKSLLFKISVMIVLIILATIGIWFIRKIVNTHYSTEIQKLEEQVEDLTLKDRLTNTFNRHYFDETFIKEFHRARRASLPLGVVFIEINMIDPTDEVLKTTAKLILSIIKRDTDFVAKYSNNTFIAVLNNTISDGVEYVVEKVVKNIDPSLEISIGVHVGIPDGHTSSQIMLNEAEKALEKAKKGGVSNIEFSLNSI